MKLLTILFLALTTTTLTEAKQRVGSCSAAELKVGCRDKGRWHGSRGEPEYKIFCVCPDFSEDVRLDYCPDEHPDCDL